MLPQLLLPPPTLGFSRFLLTLLSLITLAGVYLYYTKSNVWKKIVKVGAQEQAEVDKTPQTIAGILVGKGNGFLDVLNKDKVKTKVNINPATKYRIITTSTSGAKTTKDIKFIDLQEGDPLMIVIRAGDAELVNVVPEPQNKQ